MSRFRAQCSLLDRVLLIFGQNDNKELHLWYTHVDGNFYAFLAMQATKVILQFRSKAYKWFIPWINPVKSQSKMQILWHFGKSLCVFCSFVFRIKWLYYDRPSFYQMLRVCFKPITPSVDSGLVCLWREHFFLLSVRNICKVSVMWKNAVSQLACTPHSCRDTSDDRMFQKESKNTFIPGYRWLNFLHHSCQWMQAGVILLWF